METKGFRTGRPTFYELRLGDRVRVRISGVTGTLVKKGTRNMGWKVRWDEPRFGVTEGYMRPVDLEPIR